MGWAEFSAALVGALVPADLALRNMDSLFECKQGEQNVNEYTTKFRKLQLSTSVTEPVAMVAFMRGLKPQVSAEVFRNNPGTF